MDVKFNSINFNGKREVILSMKNAVETARMSEFVKYRKNPELAKDYIVALDQYICEAVNDRAFSSTMKEMSENGSFLSILAFKLNPNRLIDLSKESFNLFKERFLAQEPVADINVIKKFLKEIEERM